jgi:hypothetical protein
MPLRASKGAGGGMTDRDEGPPKGGVSAPGASDDGARTSHRVPEHIRFP